MKCVKIFCRPLGLLIIMLLSVRGVAVAASPVSPDNVRKVLFLGDSMTGWLSERLEAYGAVNGFEVATVVWDGSTLSKWGEKGRLKGVVDKYRPDAVFVSLGMNDMFSPSPARQFGMNMAEIKSALGDIPFVWVGPPSWPGKKKFEVFNNWLEAELGEDNFFRSYCLELPRQSKTNPHPTREGMVKWMDAVLNWSNANSNVRLNLDSKPVEKMKRGKVFIYKRMKDTL